MHDPDDLRRELAAARARTAALSAAIARTNASLDLATVLGEAADTARALTSARYGIITTVDAAGAVREFVTSGFTPEEKHQFAAWPDGPKLFAHLRDLPGPVRLADLPDYVRALGFSADLMRSRTFLGTPMRHRDVHVGHFFLAGKAGAPEFTGEDEEVLMLFASAPDHPGRPHWVLRALRSSPPRRRVARVPPRSCSQRLRPLGTVALRRRLALGRLVEFPR